VKVCGNCGGTFLPGKYTFQKFCSDRCRDIAYTRRRAERHQQRINEIKTYHGCARCGFNSHPEALDFNHIDPATKSFGLGGRCHHSWEKVIAEINKCEVLCANCHRIHTRKMRRNAASS
jgi:endogenous inhibitor of DNA gyrase (YacG/DUF329 family)